MKKTINILSILFLLQVGLGVFLMMQTDKTATFEATESLLNLSTDSVDKLIIEEKDGDKTKELQLVKKDGVWLIPSQNNFPVSSLKMREFVSTLEGFKKSWPVGHTDISAKQFKVVDKDFERKLSFFAGDKSVKTLYLGSSPGFKKVHARVDAEKSTYSLNFSAFEVPSSYKDWIDKKFLDLDRSKVSSLSIGELSLSNKSGDFLLSGLSEQQETNKEKVNSILKKILNPQFDDVLGLKNNAERGELYNKYSLTLEGGEKIEYSFYKEKTKPEVKLKEESKENIPSKVENLVLVTSKHDFAFKTKLKKVEEIFAATRDSLVKTKEAKSEGSAEKTEESGKVDASANKISAEGSLAQQAIEENEDYSDSDDDDEEI